MTHIVEEKRVLYEKEDCEAKFVGVGEKINDMQPFDAKEFSEALFAKDDGEENAAEDEE